MYNFINSQDNIDCDNSPLFSLPIESYQRRLSSHPDYVYTGLSSQLVLACGFPDGKREKKFFVNEENFEIEMR